MRKHKLEQDESCDLMSLIKPERTRLLADWATAWIKLCVFVPALLYDPGENMDNTSTEPTTMELNGTSTAAETSDEVEVLFNFFFFVVG